MRPTTIRFKFGTGEYGIGYEIWSPTSKSREAAYWDGEHITLFDILRLFFSEDSPSPTVVVLDCLGDVFYEGPIPPLRDLSYSYCKECRRIVDEYEGVFSDCGCGDFELENLVRGVVKLGRLYVYPPLQQQFVPVSLYTSAWEELPSEVILFGEHGKQIVPLNVFEKMFQLGANDGHREEVRYQG